MAAEETAGQGGRGMLGPLAASAWAQAIVRYWQCMQARGAVDASKPLALLDLAPGGAATVRLLLRALRTHGAHAPGALLRLRYLACTRDGALPTSWSAAPELRSWIDEGILAPLHWNDGEEALPWHANDAGCAWAQDNPVVVLARGAWSELEQRLFAIHYGKLLTAEFGPLAAAQGGRVLDWKPPDDGLWPAALDPLLGSYRVRLNSAPLPLPVGALRTLDRLGAIATRGYLLLGVDHGPVSEQDLRLHGFDRVAADFDEHRPLPVNFHALAWHLQQKGASVWHRAVPQERTMQLAVVAREAAEEILAAAVTPLQDELPAGMDTWAHIMKTVATHGDSDQALALLRQTRHDPRVFAAGGSALHQRLLAQAACDRAGWAEALVQVWDNHLVMPEEPELHGALASAAMRVGAWSLARRILRRGMQTHGGRDAEWVQLARCDAKTGRPDRALALTLALALRTPAPAPTDLHANQFVRCLRARVARWDGGWRRCLEHPRLPLVLEPLDDDHAEALLHQYRDPQIGVMAGLPPLANVDETRRWIAKLGATPDRIDYAVMHADAGLVGFVSLQTSAPAGYFCFWAGVDHQGQGLAAQAGTLLCDFARTQGIDWVFASAFNDNLRSIRALERVGFARVGLRNAAADDLRTFFGRGGADAGPQAATDAFLDFMRREAPEMSWVDEAGHPVLTEEATS